MQFSSILWKQQNMFHIHMSVHR